MVDITIVKSLDDQQTWLEGTLQKWTPKKTVSNRIGIALAHQPTHHQAEWFPHCRQAGHPRYVVVFPHLPGEGC